MRIEEKDFILRLIQEFGRFLRGLRDAVNDEARQLLLEARCRSICGMGLRAVDNLESESLGELLGEEARLSLSLLLVARAEVMTRAGDERVQWQHKALRLMLAFQEDGVICHSLAETAYQLMRGALDTLTAEELLSCAMFLREGSRVDLMDNAVFFLWETLPDKAAWRDRLAVLYDGIGDHALEACGMSRADIEDSLARLNDV